MLWWFRRVFGLPGWWLVHLLLAFASVVGTARYLGVPHLMTEPSFSIDVAIYLSGVVWFFGVIYRYRKRRRTLASIKSDESHSGSTEIIVSCSPRLRAFPGCYFYAYYPRRFGFKFLHFDILVDSVPLMLAWAPEPSVNSSKEKLGSSKEKLAFIVSHGNRKSRPKPFDEGQEILLDGPYGQDIKATACTTMVLAARGPGIIGLLSFASYQVSRYKHKKSREEKLRVDILWVLDHVGQQDLVGNRLRNLQDMDKDSVRNSSPVPHLLIA